MALLTAEAGNKPSIIDRARPLGIAAPSAYCRASRDSSNGNSATSSSITGRARESLRSHGGKRSWLARVGVRGRKR
jgi:hypothetical protein